jgi:predicted ArsR family transcriptional regulator
MTTVRVRRGRIALTAAETRCLQAFIQASKRLAPVIPTVEEVGGEMGVSKNSAFFHLRNLEKKGLVTRQGRKSRSLQLAAGAKTLLKRLVAEAA